MSENRKEKQELFGAYLDASYDLCLERKSGVRLYIMYGDPGCGKTHFVSQHLRQNFGQECYAYTMLTPESTENTVRGYFQYTSQGDGVGIEYKMSKMGDFLVNNKNRLSLLVFDEAHLPQQRESFWDSFRSLVDNLYTVAETAEHYQISTPLNILLIANEKPRDFLSDAFIDRLFGIYHIKQPTKNERYLILKKYLGAHPVAAMVPDFENYCKRLAKIISNPKENLFKDKQSLRYLRFALDRFFEKLPVNLLASDWLLYQDILVAAIVRQYGGFDYRLAKVKADYLRTALNQD